MSSPKRATVAQVSAQIETHIAEDRAWRAAHKQREDSRDKILAEILDNAKKTNGRVTKLEEEAIREDARMQERRRLWKIVAGAVGFAAVVQTIVTSIIVLNAQT